jgi:hypothetical protein
MDAVVIFPSRSRLVLLALGCLGGVILGYYLPTMRPRDGEFLPRELVVILSWATLAFSGLGLFYFGHRLIRRAPVLVLDCNGLLDNASALGAGFIRWDEIRAIDVGAFKGQRMLLIIPHRAEAILARQSPIKRWVMRVNAGMVGTPVTIPLGIVPVPVDELLATVEAYRSACPVPAVPSSCSEPKIQGLASER